jgi:hypothetical protein
MRTSTLRRVEALLIEAEDAMNDDWQVGSTTDVFRRRLRELLGDVAVARIRAEQAESLLHAKSGRAPS